MIENLEKLRNQCDEGSENSRIGQDLGVGRTRCRSKKGRIIETLFRVCSGKIIYLRQEQPEVGRETENKIIHLKIP